jgi:peptide/nickel transport system substrate-binding protein
MIDRRTLLQHASIGATGAALSRATLAAAQSPVASPTGKAVASITREEYYARLRDAYPLEEPGTPGGAIIYGESTDIQTVSPIVSSDSYSGLIIRLIYNYLVRPSALDGMPAPDLADSWVQEPDGVTYTFHLNPDATWHDGRPVTADDCVYSFDLTMAENSPSPRKTTVAQVLADYRKVDDHTFQLIATKPFANFVSQTAGLVGIIPKHIWEDVPADEFASDPGATGQDPARVIGSGPFIFKEWVLGDHVTLSRNETYWDSRRMPSIDEFTYRVITEGSSLVQALRTGDIDVCAVEFSDAPALAEEPDISLNTFDTTSCNWFDMMLDPERNPLFVDREVRQALMFALDRDMIAETIYEGYAIPAIGTQPVLSIAYDPATVDTIYTYDPERARSLLADAGWEDSDGDGVVEKDGVRLSFECHYSEGAAIYNQQLPYMQQAWREIGVEMQPTSVPFPTLSEMGASGNYVMRVRGYTWNVDGSQGVVFRCDSIDDGFNSMHYCNPEFDRLDDLQLSELDPVTRIDLLQQQSNILNDDVAAGFVVFRKQAIGSLTSLRNFHPNGYDTFWSIPHLWKEQDQVSHVPCPTGQTTI